MSVNYPHPQELQDFVKSVLARLDALEGKKPSTPGTAKPTPPAPPQK